MKEKLKKLKKKKIINQQKTKVTQKKQKKKLQESLSPQQSRPAQPSRASTGRLPGTSGALAESESKPTRIFSSGNNC